MHSNYYWPQCYYAGTISVIVLIVSERMDMIRAVLTTLQNKRIQIPALYLQTAGIHVVILYFHPGTRSIGKLVFISFLIFFYKVHFSVSWKQGKRTVPLVRKKNVFKGYQSYQGRALFEMKSARCGSSLKLVCQLLLSSHRLLLSKCNWLFWALHWNPIKWDVI